MVAQFTAKTANSERAIYSLSLMSCSINKLKPHMLFTYKNFVFFDFTWKNFVPGIGGKAGAAPGPPFSTALMYIYIYIYIYIYVHICVYIFSTFVYLYLIVYNWLKNTL